MIPSFFLFALPPFLFSLLCVQSDDDYGDDDAPVGGVLAGSLVVSFSRLRDDGKTQLSIHSLETLTNGTPDVRLLRPRLLLSSPVPSNYPPEDDEDQRAGEKIVCTLHFAIKATAN